MRKILPHNIVINPPTQWKIGSPKFRSIITKNNSSKKTFLILARKNEALHLTCVLNTAIFYFTKLITVLTNNVSHCLFVKQFYFSIFYKTFFYTHVAFVFNLPESYWQPYCCFQFFFFRKILIPCTSFFLKPFFVFFFDDDIYLTNLQTFLYMKNGFILMLKNGF